MIDRSKANPSTSPMILFDAAGTLIQPRESVGDTYSRVARDFGVEISPQLLSEAFVRILPLHYPMTVPMNLSPFDHKQAELLWWKALGREVFQSAVTTTHFDSIFEVLFEHFRKASAWLVFPDVLPTLQRLRRAGLRLAVVSNFDSRLEDILAALELHQYFEAIHFSTNLGFAKPDPRIFETVLSYHQLHPDAVWHVGDSLRDDVQGALNAGIRPIWLDRSGSGINNDRLARIQRLDELPDLLLKE